MNRIKNLVAIGIFSLLVLGIPAIASAQYRDRDRDRDDDRYGNNGGYNNGQYGQYGNSGYGDMRSTIRSLKSKARDFQRQVDRDLDHSPYNGTRREDQINQLAKQFKNVVNDLDKNGYNSNDRYGDRGYGNGNNRGDNEIRRVFDIASQIERSISRNGIGYNSQSIWSSIRRDLDGVGRNYGYDNGNYRNRQRRGSGNGQYGNPGWNKPSWWPF